MRKEEGPQNRLSKEAIDFANALGALLAASLIAVQEKTRVAKTSSCLKEQAEPEKVEENDHHDGGSTGNFGFGDLRHGHTGN